MISLEKNKVLINIFKSNCSESDAYIKIEASTFKDGLISMLQPRNFVVLLTIYSFMFESNNLKPTVKQIAERSGYSPLTVKAAIKELKEFELDGELLLPSYLY